MLVMNQLLNSINMEAISDIHLKVNMPPIVRLGGQLRQIDTRILTEKDLNQLVEELLKDSPRLLENFKSQGQVDLAYRDANNQRYRINIYKEHLGYALALRRVADEIPSSKLLGLPEDLIVSLAKERNGLILVTGPTGSGKTTTLAALINAINHTRSEHILTLEDPIEYVHKSKECIISQREIGTDSISYATALKAALREDPNVILIGEMRDLETISTAITAAETGHLVLSSLHTVNAMQTIERIIDVFPVGKQEQVKLQLANLLRGVICQQLIADEDLLKRHIALEVMIPNNAIRHLIREGKVYQIYSHIQMGKSEGMCTMDASVKELYQAGKIPLKKAIQYISKKEELQSIRPVGEI